MVGIHFRERDTFLHPRPKPMLLACNLYHPPRFLSIVLWCVCVVTLSFRYGYWLILPHLLHHLLHVFPTHPSSLFYLLLCVSLLFRYGFCCFCRIFCLYPLPSVLAFLPLALCVRPCLCSFFFAMGLRYFCHIFFPALVYDQLCLQVPCLLPDDSLTFPCPICPPSLSPPYLNIMSNRSCSHAKTILFASLQCSPNNRYYNVLYFYTSSYVIVYPTSCGWTCVRACDDECAFCKLRGGSRNYAKK
ncbi:hypothetical protein GYMLUDRAFT_779925 [Collybiopsis luxurians FD-317 M1]|uniref:Uncharacterized protein n=1 Tax=Collybiopsis luxurians FD-317 M1 TaxID=944289 RepID=A0A0D0CF01_9AGAR|nr:hypothetical protein GYMLUDRAFT_779925 [Collybiopsis luxurians FD-317 M1]